MNQELKQALFSAEAVAHLRGFEREILPLADLARGMDARIAELEGALRGILEAPGAGYVAMSEPDSFETQCSLAAEVLARPVKPLTPENLKP